MFGPSGTVVDSGPPVPWDIGSRQPQAPSEASDDTAFGQSTTAVASSDLLKALIADEGPPPEADPPASFPIEPPRPAAPPLAASRSTAPGSTAPRPTAPRPAASAPRTTPPSALAQVRHAPVTAEEPTAAPPPPDRMVDQRGGSRRVALFAAIFVAGLGSGIGAAAFLVMRSRPSSPPLPPPALAETPPPSVASAPEPPPAPAPTLAPAEPAAATETAVPAPPKNNQLVVEGDEAQKFVRLAIAGSPKGMSHYRVAKPRGTAVRLPRARPVLRPGAYKPGSPFVAIRIQRKRTGSVIVFFYESGRKPAVTVEDGMIQFALRR